MLACPPPRPHPTARRGADLAGGHERLEGARSPVLATCRGGAYRARAWLGPFRPMPMTRGVVRSTEAPQGAWPLPFAPETRGRRVVPRGFERHDGLMGRPAVPGGASAFRPGALRDATAQRPAGPARRAASVADRARTRSPTRRRPGRLRDMDPDADQARARTPWCQQPRPLGRPEPCRRAGPAGR